jgi:hypothetical protein
MRKYPVSKLIYRINNKGIMNIQNTFYINKFIKQCSLMLYVPVTFLKKAIPTGKKQSLKQYISLKINNYFMD